MKLLAKILMGVDISVNSDDYIDRVTEFAKKFNSVIIPLYVLKPSTRNKNIQKILFDASVHKLNLIRDKIRKEGLQCEEPIIATGNPAIEIVNEAQVNDVNLIILKKHHKSDRLLADNLGVVIEKIIHKTEIPVYVINDEKKKGINNILCPIDFSKSSVRALKNAITLSRRFDANLTIMNVYESPHPYMNVDEDILNKEIEKERKRNLKKFDSFMSKNQFKDIPLKTIITSGFPEVEILTKVKELNIDLLIMGSSGRSGISRFFMGSTTEKVIRETACSFITTKSKSFIKVVLESKMNDLDTHFREAQLLHEDGLFDRAIREYKLCIEIDNMHIRSYNGIAKIYEELGKTKKAQHYKNMAKDIYDHMWDEKIEREIRKHYKSSLSDHQIHQ